MKLDSKYDANLPKQVWISIWW